MKFVALVSGGKDSCYSILKCQEHGHELVALANLHPEASGPDDLDSYCFQTVGHQMLPMYPECMNVPLYRKSFAGQSISRDLQYCRAENDEVEDLHALLAFVQSKHPDVVGVSSGAIASDYQRLRVENVCGRLGMVSLAYLWHQPQETLLQGMVDAGLHSILVKVASLGLSQKHLGKPLAHLQHVLIALAEKFGCNICGEGGEFETLTLDGPMFSHGQIVLEDFSIHTIDSSDIAPVAILRPETFSVAPKTSAAEGTPNAAVVDVPHDWTPPQQPPPIVQATLDATRTVTASALMSHGSVGAGVATLQAFGGHSHALARMAHPGTDAGTAQLLEATSLADTPPGSHTDAQRTGSSGAESGAEASADFGESGEHTGAAVAAALSQIQAGLQARGCGWHDVLYVHLFLRHMPHFAAANAAYRGIVPQSSAPARACVAAPLPPGVLCSVDVIVTTRAAPCTAGGMPQHSPAAGAASPRRVLHVQGHSEWAPASIGPYSQATVWHGLLQMAGQIPLDPGSMEVTTSADVGRCVRSCAAIATALGCHLPSSLLASVTFHTPATSVAAAALAHAALRGDVHALDAPTPTAAPPQTPAGARHSNGLVQGTVADTVGGESEYVDGDGAASMHGGLFGVEPGEERGDSYRVVRRVCCAWEPPQLLVCVPALPRGCGVEVQALAAVPAAAPPQLRRREAAGSDSDDSRSDEAAEEAPLAGGAWAHSLESESSRREHRAPGDGVATQGHPETGAPGGSVPAELRVLRVASRGAIALVQIACGKATPAGGVPCTGQSVQLAPTSAGSAGGAGSCNPAVDGEWSTASRRQAVELLREVGDVLREQCSRAGVDHGELCNVRLFVVSEMAAQVRAVLRAAVEEVGVAIGSTQAAPDPGHEGIEGLLGCAEADGEGNFVGVSAASMSGGWSWGVGVPVTEVSGLHDENGSLLWAIRAMVVCI